MRMAQPSTTSTSLYGDMELASNWLYFGVREVSEKSSLRSEVKSVTSTWGGRRGDSERGEYYRVFCTDDIDQIIGGPGSHGQISNFKMVWSDSAHVVRW